jgi:DNA-binding IclR family transcriptional regulator
MTTKSDREVPGSQSIARAIGLLKLIASSPSSGLSLAQVAHASGLNSATAHRQLSALIREGLVEQNASHHYFPGIELWLLGQVAAHRFDICGIARESMRRLAEETEDTVYLFIRSGRQAVCIAREEGSFPIRALTLTPGDRRPLGVNAGALALLAFLAADEREDVLSELDADLQAYPNYTIAVVRREIETTRSRGYSQVQGTIIPGMGAVGVAIRDRGGHAMASISVAAMEQRMSADRGASIAQIIHREAKVLADKLFLSGRSRGNEEDAADSMGKKLINRV